jgi:hypothetical protein
MGQTHGGTASDSDGSSSDEEVDRLASCSHTGILLEVMAPRCEGQQSNNAEGARTRVISDTTAVIGPDTVLLNVYDLESFRGANKVLAFAIDESALGGAFHAGVEIFGGEWSYGSSGVKCEQPRAADGHIYRCTVALGNTALSPREVATILHELCQAWRGHEYDLLSRNCCSFAAAFCGRLGAGPMPPWVDRFARVLSHGRSIGHQVGAALGAAATKAVEVGNWLTAKENLEEVRPGGEVVLRLPNSDEAIAVQGQFVHFSSLDLASIPGAIPPANYVARVLQHSNSFGNVNEAITVQPFPSFAAIPGAIPPPNDIARPRQQSTELDGPVTEWKYDEGQLARPLSDMSDVLVDPVISSQTFFADGTEVEYHSLSVGKWIPARVVRYNDEHSMYHLDVKQGAIRAVPHDRIRAIPASGQGYQVHASCIEACTNAAESPEASVEYESTLAFERLKFPLGASVEYESSSHGRWIAAKVLSFDASSNLYDLDCKNGVPSNRIRWPMVLSPIDECDESSIKAASVAVVDDSITLDNTTQVLDLAVGSAVEYYSPSHCRWIPAKVVGRRGLDDYDLDCKPAAPIERIRRPQNPAAAAPLTTTTLLRGF